VNRRMMLKTGGMAVMALGAGACGTGSSAATARPVAVPTGAMPPRPALNLGVVRAARDRVIRTTVGLRPHRPSGFVLKAAKLDDRTIFHNYGHGGAGMSLAWGMGAMIGDMARHVGDRRAAVVGCGSPGLTAARQLQRRGFDVTIYAMSVPPYTTSNMSTAGFTPTSGLVETDRRTPAWDVQFREACEISYRELQLLAGTPGYGVYWMDSYNVTEDPAPENEGQGGGTPGGEIPALLPDHLRPGRHREVLGPGEHPFPSTYAVRTSTLSIEPSIYLEALMRDFARFGGRIVMRTFDTPRDLMSLPEPVIVNCTGLGSKTLFGDEELIPVKGQLTALIPQAEVTYRLQSPRPDGEIVRMNSRSDGIIIGNLMERGNWSLEPDEDVRQRVLASTIEFFAAMQPPSAAAYRRARSTPPRGIPNLTSFFGTES